MSKKIIFASALVLLCVAVTFFYFSKNNKTSDPASSEIINKLDARDTVSEFYHDWLDASLSTSTDPYEVGLASDARLSDQVKNYLNEKKDDDSATVDPVICQPNLPNRIGFNQVYMLEDSGQYLVFPSGGPVPERALVDVKLRDTGWQIDKIECIYGESVPTGEYSFERSGYILKTDQPPLEGNKWYLTFEENGKEGHFAPLSFSAESICKIDGNESVCNPDTFVNPSQATVKGEMQEAGVDVLIVEF